MTATKLKLATVVTLAFLTAGVGGRIVASGSGKEEGGFVRATQTSTGPLLGMNVDDSEDKEAPPKDKEARAFLGLRLRGEDDAAIVDGVIPNSPAAKAGFEEEDVLLKLDKMELKHPNDVVKAIAAKKPGDKVTFVLKRDGKEKSLTVTLGQRPAEEDNKPVAFAMAREQAKL